MKYTKSVQLTLIKEKKIRDTSFAEFAENLVQYDPRIFGRLLPHRLGYDSLYLQRHFNLSPMDLQLLIEYLEREYGIALCELHRYRIKHPTDIKLRHLYRLLQCADSMYTNEEDS